MRKTTAYDFHLALETDPQHGTICRILRSPAGRGSAPFVRPKMTATPAASSLRQRVEAQGHALFEALFSGVVGEKYRTSLAKLGPGPTDTRRRLRIRLAIDPDDDALADLLRLDWEELYDGRSFLTRGLHTTLVHDLEVAPPLLDLPGSPPLRLLVVGASPKEWPEIDLEAELARIREVWQGEPNVVIEPLLRTSFRELRQRLRRGEPVHVIHFVGHGEIEEGENEGMLIFELGDHSPEPVTGTRMAEALGVDPDLRLVVLNACETATGPTLAPGRSVAAQLIKVGVPAVVAMRPSVADLSAAVFATAFYEALADGCEVDDAVDQARLAIDETEEDFHQWSAPALFMSSHDGRLFQWSGSDDPRTMQPKRLGIKSRDHPFGELEEASEHVLDLVPHFEGRQIRNAADWADKIDPDLRQFFRQHVHNRRPLVLRMDAHLTICFVAGRAIDTRGVDVTILQGGANGFEPWSHDRHYRHQGPLWKVSEVERAGAAGREIAVAVGVLKKNLADVERYVGRHLAERVSKVLVVEAEPEPSTTVVDDGNHAFALAQALKALIDGRDAAEQAGDLHLFIASPGVFAFYLGQLSRGFGTLQLYEFEFEEGGERNYVPSLRIVPEKGGRR